LERPSFPTFSLTIDSLVARVQCGKLKSKREIHVPSIFREMPPEFLRMIVVHEISHLKEPEHDKAFYQLCQHMEADYFQLEFNQRAHLCHLAAAVSGETG
jgi:UTP pyrophosphatase